LGASPDLRPSSKLATASLPDNQSFINSKVPRKSPAMRAGRRPRHGGEGGSKHQRPRGNCDVPVHACQISATMTHRAGAIGTGGARWVSRRAAVGTARDRDRGLTMRRYPHTRHHRCFAWIAIVQVVMTLIGRAATRSSSSSSYWLAAPASIAGGRSPFPASSFDCAAAPALPPHQCQSAMPPSMMKRSLSAFWWPPFPSRG
jgi:hypothetical protein